MPPILTLAIILSLGFLLGEVAKKLHFPKVTGYIIAGLLLNPSLLAIVPKDFTDHTEIVTSIALSFITFSVGGTLLYSRVKSLGKSILSITFFEAEFAFLAVAVGLACVAPFIMQSNNQSWLTTVLPMSLLIASLASPTDPSATLAVTHEYKASGTVTSTIMGVAASDDAIGLINYSLAVPVAQALTTHTEFALSSSIIRPPAIIVGAVTLGILSGFAFNVITRLAKKETEGALVVVILALLSLCYGTATLLGLDELLATMTMGIIVVNFNPRRNTIFRILERYTEELVFVLFFTLSAMHLDVAVLPSAAGLVALFVVFRTIGKMSGTALGASLSKSPSKVKKYAAGGLIPQGGIVIGLALLIKQNPAFDGIADIIISVIIGSAVIHELAGPLLAKLALKKAGELHAG